MTPRRSNLIIWKTATLSWSWWLKPNPFLNNPPNNSNKCSNNQLFNNNNLKFNNNHSLFNNPFNSPFNSLKYLNNNNLFNNSNNLKIKSYCWVNKPIKPLTKWSIWAFQENNVFKPCALHSWTLIEPSNIFLMEFLKCLKNNPCLLNNNKFLNKLLNKEFLNRDNKLDQWLKNNFKSWWIHPKFNN